MLKITPLKVNLPVIRGVLKARIHLEILLLLLGLKFKLSFLKATYDMLTLPFI